MHARNNFAALTLLSYMLAFVRPARAEDDFHRLTLDAYQHNIGGNNRNHPIWHDTGAMLGFAVSSKGGIYSTLNEGNLHGFSESTFLSRLTNLVCRQGVQRPSYRDSVRKALHAADPDMEGERRLVALENLILGELDLSWCQLAEILNFVKYHAEEVDQTMTDAEADPLYYAPWRVDGTHISRRLNPLIIPGIGIAALAIYNLYNQHSHLEYMSVPQDIVSKPVEPRQCSALVDRAEYRKFKVEREKLYGMLHDEHCALPMTYAQDSAHEGTVSYHSRRCLTTDSNAWIAPDDPLYLEFFHHLNGYLSLALAGGAEQISAWLQRAIAARGQGNALHVSVLVQMLTITILLVQSYCDADAALRDDIITDAKATRDFLQNYAAIFEP